MSKSWLIAGLSAVYSADDFVGASGRSLKNLKMVVRGKGGGVEASFRVSLDIPILFVCNFYIRFVLDKDQHYFFYYILTPSPLPDA